MASIQKRIRNGKTTYRVQYRDPSAARGPARLPSALLEDGVSVRAVAE